MARGTNQRMASVRTEVLEDTLRTTDEEIKNSPYDLKNATKAMWEHNNTWLPEYTNNYRSEDMDSALKYGNPSEEWIDKMKATYGNSNSNFWYDYLEYSLPMPSPLAINNFTRNEEEIVFQKQRIKDYENGEERREKREKRKRTSDKKRKE